MVLCVPIRSYHKPSEAQLKSLADARALIGTRLCMQCGQRTDIDHQMDGAISIHGITNEDVAGAPSWAALYGEFYRLIENRVVVIYNEDFDVRLLAQTASRYRLDAPKIQSVCAMKLYARWYGEERSMGKYQWQRLSDAAQQCGINVSGAHRAYADCLMTKGVAGHMASTILRNGSE